MLGSRSWHGMWQLIMSLAGLSLASTRWVTILKSTQIGRQVNKVGFVGHQTGDFWRNHDFKQTAAFFLLHNWFKDTVGKIFYPTICSEYKACRKWHSPSTNSKQKSKCFSEKGQTCPKMSPPLPAQNPHVLQIREEDGHTNIWGQTEALWGRKSDLQDFVFLASCAVCSLRFSKGRCRNETAFCFWWYFPFSLQPKIVTASKFERHLDEEVYLENLNFFDAVSFSYYAVH